MSSHDASFRQCGGLEPKATPGSHPGTGGVSAEDGVRRLITLINLNQWKREKCERGKKSGWD